MIEGPMYYDIDGQPIGMMTWAKLQNPTYKRVAEDTIEVDGKSYWVSTVWMGLDHSFSLGDHPPIIFETMVFLTEGVSKPAWDGGDWSDLAMDRYATKEEALAGHAAMCEMVRNKQLESEEDE